MNNIGKKTGETKRRVSSETEQNFDLDNSDRAVHVRFAI
jgi:hypothetical protein